ncbi:MAG: nitronate monooxygenase [Desulfobacterales bacterium]|nr:nitronate monooxygenase [Desulfobacterales bacterium]
MFKTKITEMLGIKYPIIGGTMMWISDAPFTAAISEAGGLGVLASANYKTKPEFSDAIDKLKDLTDKPFAVNINLFPSLRPIDNNEYVDVLIKKGVKIVETSGHSAPVDLCAKFKEAGMTWIHKCVGIKYALKVKALGADIITVVGYENGGATGKLDIGTIVLVPVVKDAVGLPIIGGGGVSDGRGLVAVLSLGADAVIIGTRLLLTKECPIHDNLKQALLNASELDTMLIMRSFDATHRVLTNTAAKKCSELETSKADLNEIFKVVSGERAKSMYDHGDINEGIVACGQGIGLIHDIPSMKELFDSIMVQAEKVVTGLSKTD